MNMQSSAIYLIRLYQSQWLRGKLLRLTRQYSILLVII